jgi:hypothetical protein
MGADIVKIQNRGWEEVKVPSVPNFILRPSDGFPIPIAELSDTQLRILAKAWTEALIKKAQARRAKL